LIKLSDNKEESLIYVSSAIKMHGEQGKKYIMLLAQEDKKIGEVFM
jgi:hypothetical protein